MKTKTNSNVITKMFGANKSLGHGLKGWFALQVLSVCAFWAPDMTHEKLIELCFDIANQVEVDK